MVWRVFCLHSALYVHHVRLMNIFSQVCVVVFVTHLVSLTDWCLQAVSDRGQKMWCGQVCVFCLAVWLDLFIMCSLELWSLLTCHPKVSAVIANAIMHLPHWRVILSGDVSPVLFWQKKCASYFAYSGCDTHHRLFHDSLYIASLLGCNWVSGMRICTGRWYDQDCKGPI